MFALSRFTVRHNNAHTNCQLQKQCQAAAAIAVEGQQLNNYLAWIALHLTWPKSWALLQSTMVGVFGVLRSCLVLSFRLLFQFADNHSCMHIII